AAQLLIKASGLDEPKVQEDLLGRIIDLGITPERVRMLGSSPHPEHLKIYHEIDVALDPYPQGGGVSTAEALWMGVPVVTLQGSVLPSRISASFLSVLQMQDWIATSAESYVQIAIAAAKDLSRLATLRKGLR